MILKADTPVEVRTISESDGTAFVFSNKIASEHRAFDGSVPLVETMPDGSVWVSDDNRVLGATPAHVISKAFGRFGAGPGEFAYINAICRTVGDSIVLLDGSGRYTLLDTALNTLRHFRAERSASISAQGGCLHDGSLLVTVLRDRDSSDVFRLDTRGALLERITTVPNDVTLLTGAELTIAASPEGVLIANPLDGSIINSDLRGNPLARYRLTGLTSAQQRAGQIPQMSRGNTTGPRNERLTVEPSPMRYFRSATLDGRGRLWVQDVSVPEDSRDSWTVFDSRSGATLLRLELVLKDKTNSAPRVLKIDTTNVIFMYQDSLGHPTLRTVAVPAT